MRYVLDRGYPAPRVIDVSGPDLVLERVEGPTMLAGFFVGRPMVATAIPAWLALGHRTTTN